ncbi:hypothetical protein ABZZ79_07340 [Streptomyces sp. NPDC006458]|uniref:hypothetical protein n=1 Tax=Streptomyces sp. NPDC006458 TaxID=3154302 RepID=UPI0033BD8EAA
MGDAVDVRKADPARPQDEVDGLLGPHRVVLDPGELFLAHSRDDLRVTDEAGTGEISVGNAKGKHISILFERRTPDT